MMFNTGNKVPRRKPGSRPRTYRDIYYQTPTRSVAAAGLTNLGPILSDEQLESQSQAGRSSQADVPRVSSASGERPRQRVKSGQEMCLKHRKDVNSLTPPPPPRTTFVKTKTDGERKPGHRFTVPPPPQPNHQRNRHQSKAQSESGLETLEHQFRASPQNHNYNYQSLPIIALPPGLPQLPPAPSLFASQSQDPDSEAEWHESCNSVNVETIWEQRESYVQAVSEPMVHLPVASSSTGNINLKDPSRTSEAHAHWPRSFGFDLRDCYDSGVEMNDDELDTDDEDRHFGKIPYDRLIRDNILEISDTIVFSPYKPRSNRDSYNWNWFKADRQDQTEARGCFKAVIRMRNTSKFNMTYQIKSSSLKMFRISEQIGYILPETTKEIAVLTNPRMNYTFEEIADCSFVIEAHPALFRRQILPVMIDAFWRAIDSEILSHGILEIHRIKWVRAESDSLLDAHSILGRLRILWPFRGNPGRVESLCLPPIDARTFNRIWHTNDPRDRLLQLKFQNRQLHRKVIRYEVERTEQNLAVKQLTVAFALTTFTYIFVGFIIYVEHYQKSQVAPASPPPPDTTWYEDAYSYMVDLFSGWFGNVCAATGAAALGWFV